MPFCAATGGLYPHLSEDKIEPRALRAYSKEETMELQVEAVRETFSAIHQKMREQVQGVSAEGLNWRPGPDANPLYALVTHMLGSERFFLHKALGQEVARDREAEFLASGEDDQTLLRRIAQAEEEMRRLLGAITAEDLARETELRGTRRTGAWYLVNVLSHLSEHIGHLNLTRQLWEQRR